MKKYQIIYGDSLERLWYRLGDYLCRHKRHHWNYRYCSRCGMDVFDFVKKEIDESNKYYGFSSKEG